MTSGGEDFVESRIEAAQANSQDPASAKPKAGSVIGRHVQMAHATIKGEHQLSEYVQRLGLDECVEILAESTASLASLASRHGPCRVEAGEDRSFDEVIRTWTLYVLSGIEAG